MATAATAPVLHRRGRRRSRTVTGASHARSAPPSSRLALTQAILDELSPTEVWAILLDEGRYLCSIATFYRLLRRAGETRERRRQATHPATVKPERVATTPNAVWSWDITKLRGPSAGRICSGRVCIPFGSTSGATTRRRLLDRRSGSCLGASGVAKTEALFHRDARLDEQLAGEPQVSLCRPASWSRNVDGAQR